MLVLKVKKNESVIIKTQEQQIEVVLLGGRNSVKLGFIAPPDIKILRGDLWGQENEEKS